MFGGASGPGPVGQGRNRRVWVSQGITLPNGFIRTQHLGRTSLRCFATASAWGWRNPHHRHQVEPPTSLLSSPWAAGADRSPRGARSPWGVQPGRVLSPPVLCSPLVQFFPSPRVSFLHHCSPSPLGAGKGRQPQLGHCGRSWLGGTAASRDRVKIRVGAGPPGFLIQASATSQRNFCHFLCPYQLQPTRDAGRGIPPGGLTTPNRLIPAPSPAVLSATGQPLHQENLPRASGTLEGFISFSPCPKSYVPAPSVPPLAPDNELTSAA